MQKQVGIIAHWWFQYILVVTAERHSRYAGVRRNLPKISFLSPSSSQVIKFIIQPTWTSKGNGTERRQ
jgi:hypothetical protein